MNKIMRRFLSLTLGSRVRKSQKILLKYQAKRSNQYQPLPWIGHTKSKRTEASIARWDMIKPELPDPPFSALDVGANAGYFSLRLAESGGFVIGIDQVCSIVKLATRVKEYARINGCAFTDFSLTCENIMALGTYDVILMLSVFHNMAHFSGYNDAKIMLAALLNKTQKLMIFETGECGPTGYAASMPDMGDDRDAWIRQLLMDSGAYRVKLLGKAPVVDDSPSLRSVYAVYK